jgi:hypothetical protein
MMTKSQTEPGVRPHITIAGQKYMPGVNDSAFVVIDGKRYEWINLEDLVSFATGIAMEGYTFYRFENPRAIKVPAEKPTEGMATKYMPENSMQDWFAYLGGFCKIDSLYVPDPKLTLVVDPKMVVDYQRLRNVWTARDIAEGR